MKCDHTFIVSCWKTEGIRTFAESFICEKCLTLSKDIEAAEELKDEVSSNKNKRNSKRSVSSKANTHGDREEVPSN